jgi:hypothetical protein
MSSAIFEELMNIGGGERWRRYKQERVADEIAQSNTGTNIILATSEWSLTLPIVS